MKMILSGIRESISLSLLSKKNALSSLSLLLLFLWCSAPYWIYLLDPAAALVDYGIWHLLLVAVLVFLFLLWLCGYLFGELLKNLMLPAVAVMVEHIGKLELWQQIFLYWASFVALLFAAVGCLMALC